MESNEFYDSLKIVESLRGVLDPSQYKPLPDSWYVVVADIRSSTDAIRLGKYKEVNMAGACILAAINNELGRDKLLPYLFSGDGSMLVLPDDDIERIKGLLAFCKLAVKDAYDLDMDIGVIRVSKIRALGHDISVARLKLSDTIDQAVFWGSGVTYAENHIKEHDLLEDVEPLEADFSGLECRWQQLPSQFDEVSAYIIQAVGVDDEESTKIYEECFNRIEAVYGNESEFHPIYNKALRMTINVHSLSVEWKLQVQPPTILKKIRFILQLVFQYTAGKLLMKTNKKTSDTDWGSYKSDLIKQADYKKFSDGLRFVATGTIKQRMEITDFLDRMFEERKLAYGVHPSFAAMITCYVKKYQNDHIHFVDGTDGGYAKASQELKVRRKKLGLS